MIAQKMGPAPGPYLFLVIGSGDRSRRFCPDSRFQGFWKMGKIETGNELMPLSGYFLNPAVPFIFLRKWIQNSMCLFQM
ncbi:hypothetical protein CEXT_381811 [Caerostris extrusa]|uniref:Uncharacterized protein n=1 Tax=Caerostris extrusa TaxID=172846 RepID=A0AAV4WES3_CAEEX|nr:hypothetical protein CEXT_381811 [Caerostris extrusa]